jgi:hypothetical protein
MSDNVTYIKILSIPDGGPEDRIAQYNTFIKTAHGQTFLEAVKMGRPIVPVVLNAGFEDKPAPFIPYTAEEAEKHAAELALRLPQNALVVLCEGGPRNHRDYQTDDTMGAFLKGLRDSGANTDSDHLMIEAFIPNDQWAEHCQKNDFPEGLAKYDATKAMLHAIEVHPHNVTTYVASAEGGHLRVAAFMGADVIVYPHNANAQSPSKDTRIKGIKDAWVENGATVVCIADSPAAECLADIAEVRGDYTYVRKAGVTFDPADIDCRPRIIETIAERLGLTTAATPKQTMKPIIA